MFALLIAVATTAAMAGPPPTPPTQKKAPHALDGSYVQVKITGGFTPYRLVTYEVLWRGKVAVASHYRGLVNYPEAMHRMKLVPTSDYKALLSALEKDGAFELDDRKAPEDRAAAPGTLTYRLEIKRGDKKRIVTVMGLRAARDARYAAVVDRVRRFVLARAGDLSFRNVFFEPGTFGYVNLTAVPVATIWIDGREIRRETPIYGYELPAGNHKVKLVAVKEGWEREHTLRVEPGMTTIVHFDLR